MQKDHKTNNFTGRTIAGDAQRKAQGGLISDARGCPKAFWRRYFTLINTVMESR